MKWYKARLGFIRWALVVLLTALCIDNVIAGVAWRAAFDGFFVGLLVGQALEELIVKKMKELIDLQRFVIARYEINRRLRQEDDHPPDDFFIH